MQCGETPTIKDAAEAAGVSRATAYRYFTSQQALLLEASLDAIGTVPDPSLVDEGPVESRVDAAIRSLVRMAYEHEPSCAPFECFPWSSGCAPTRRATTTTPCARAGG